MAKSSQTCLKQFSIYIVNKLVLKKFLCKLAHLTKQTYAHQEFELLAECHSCTQCFACLLSGVAWLVILGPCIAIRLSDVAVLYSWRYQSNFTHNRYWCVTYQLMYDFSWLIMFVVFADQCHEMSSAAPVQCPKITKARDDCVVDRATAFDICAETPGCKYVLTTINAEWNSKFPDAAMLGKHPLKNNSEWKSCELSTTTRKC